MRTARSPFARIVITALLVVVAVYTLIPAATAILTVTGGPPSDDTEVAIYASIGVGVALDASASFDTQGRVVRFAWSPVSERGRSRSSWSDGRKSASASAACAIRHNTAWR